MSWPVILIVAVFTYFLWVIRHPSPQDLEQEQEPYND